MITNARPIVKVSRLHVMGNARVGTTDCVNVLESIDLYVEVIERRIITNVWLYAKVH